MKKCGTCKFWTGAEAGDGFRLCEWEPPALPFWASIDTGMDHEDYTRDGDGKSCRAWVQK